MTDAMDTTVAASSDAKRWTVTCSLNVADLELARDSHNVYVGDIAPQVTEDELRGAFASAGDVIDVRVMKDRVTSVNKGFAFVHLGSRAAFDAVLTAPEYQHITLHGRVLRVKASEQKTVLFLGNLPMELSADEVRDAVHSLLQPRLNPANVKVDVKFHPPPERRSKGFGFASFDSNAQADFARRVLGASTINGRQVNASWAEHPPAEAVRAGPAQTTVYVSGLNTRVSEDVLRALFEQFGDVSKCLAPRNPASDELKGYAFVQLPARAHCDRAIAELDDTDFMGAKLKVSIAKPPGEKSGKAAQGAVGGMTGGRAPRGANPYQPRAPAQPYGANPFGNPFGGYPQQPQWNAYAQPQYGQGAQRGGYGGQYGQRPY